MTGSSPLARGLHHMMELLAVTTRIIPARAGFTRQPCCRWPGRPDHPRSRGVYVHVNRGYPWSDGSSPLARGLLELSGLLDEPLGIIPARAGFTPRRRLRRRALPDHPRSRGVYIEQTLGVIITKGSSPLARGLLGGDYRRVQEIRIIPARAGFTLAVTVGTAATADHPRSRGVYGRGFLPFPFFWGSSPLARGLHHHRDHRQHARRIIPARAGFTSPTRTARAGRWDHPRSRGVYAGVISHGSSGFGSSPLARGLREDDALVLGRPGIIPARAGFTEPHPLRRLLGWDHPRSRGVYACGSLESQRRATLPDLVCLHCRPSARSAEFR